MQPNLEVSGDRKAFTLACPNPFDALRAPTEYLGNEILLRAYWRDVYLTLVPRETYPMHVGKTQSIFTIERNYPAADEETWLPISVLEAGDAGTACDNTWNDTYVGETEKTFTPEQFALQGPILCKDELIFLLRPDEFWEKYMVGLTNRSTFSVSNRLLTLYSQLAPKSVARTDYQRYDQSTLVLPVSTCALTQEMLDQTAIELMQDGATEPNSNGWITFGKLGPLFTLYIGMEASQRLLKTNAEFRNDIRYAFDGDGNMAPLMLRLASAMELKNFKHLICLFPPRYTYGGGTYTRVNTWTVSNASKGQKAVLSTSYKNAPYEAAAVLSPWVMTEQLVPPQNAVAGMTFNPETYFGEWEWVTGGRNISVDPSCFDPTGKYGRHFAQYKHAVYSKFPEYGRWIFFKRCLPGSFECASCT